MRELLVWEQNWLRQCGWSSEQIAALSVSNDQTPVEYLTGHARFIDLILQVNRQVLIPRVETEQLIELVKQAVWQSGTTINSIVEVGTGSGAIAIALARALPSVTIVATDISEGALSCARANVHHYFLDERIKLLWADLLIHSQLPPADNYFLVANLPYIPTRDYQKLDTCVREYEPRLALDGGADGFEVIRHLLKQVAPLENKPLGIFLEVDPSHSLDFVRDYSQYQWQKVTDEFGRGRFLVGTRIDKIDANHNE